MGLGNNTSKESIIAELAEAISSFNIDGVAMLLADDGNYAIQDENLKIVISGKDEFLRWLRGCYSKLLFGGSFRRRLSLNIVRCMHCVTRIPIIVFEKGRFPVYSGTREKYAQNGLVIISDETRVTGIELCLLVKKIERPFIYEKRCLKPDL
jgi:hypothetical protein